MASDTAFRQTVLDISHSLSAYDLEQIMYLHKIPEDGKISPLSVLKRLERRGIFTASQPEGLENLLKAIHRNDLCGTVEEYCSRYKALTSCCGVKPACRHISGLVMLCVAQAEGTHKHVFALQKCVEKFSDSQRRTPQSDKFFKEMEEEFQLLKSEHEKYLVSPLNDLQRRLRIEDNKRENVDSQPLSRENPSTNEPAHANTTPTSSVPTALGHRSKSLEWDAPDYDNLEPKKTPHGSPSAMREPSTRSPVLTRATLLSEARAKHSSPGGNPHMPALLSRASQSSSPSDTSALTYSGDDSGFGEPRHLPRHPTHTQSTRVTPFPHNWRESQEYMPLDPATADESSVYTSIQPRSRRQ